MGDWAQTNQDYNRTAINTFGVESTGIDQRNVAQAGAATAVPTKNQATYVPFVVYNQFTATKLSVIVGTATGSVDVGIYSAEQARLVSSGPTDVAGTNAIQTFDITDTTLEPGVYYAAFLASNTNATFTASQPAVPVVGAMGILSQAVGSATLPATAAFAAAADTFIPFVMIASRTTI